jgi:uncharacterized protein (DUF4415 family)
MARVDAHEIASHEYDEAPDLADFDASKGVLEVAGKPIRGRPALGEKAKRLVTLRLDPDVINAFKATGEGWQTRINDTLAKASLSMKPKDEG